MPILSFAERLPFEHRYVSNYVKTGKMKITSTYLPILPQLSGSSVKVKEEKSSCSLQSHSKQGRKNCRTTKTPMD
jgi:hypothetical protein